MMKNTKLNVCIVGGGHIGTTLACYIKHAYSEHRVNLYTWHSEKFSDTIKCNDIENERSYTVTIDKVSSDPRYVIADSDIIFVALPHFMIEKAFSDISPYVKDGAVIGVIPGGGGCEFFFEKYFNRNITLFGFQRVPFTAKVAEYGRETNLKSWKPYSVVGTIYKDRIDDVCELIENCGLKTKKASDYLEIALTPTNPILHTSRTFELFGKFDRGHIFEHKMKFYVGWGNEASQILFSMDSELHQLLDSLEIDTSAIIPLSEHYESHSVDAMTKKINSIATFQSVYAPLKEVEKGFVTDTDSRMFSEDFPWGLLVFRSYFDFFNIKAPTMDRLLQWYSSYMGYDWYDGDRLIYDNLKSTGAIQKYGISSGEDLINFYNR